MRLLTILVTVAATAGCQGVIGDSKQDAPVDLEPGDGLPNAEECLDATPSSGHRPFARLTQRQYRNTLRDLLAIDSDVAQGFVDDEGVVGFEVARSTSPIQVEKFLDAARALAAQVDVTSLGSCVEGEDCAREMTANLGRRAFRRALTDEERADLLATWRIGAEGGTFADGIRLVVEAVLASPDFLYHVEVGGEPGAAVALDDFALASRLSYFLWDTMPDDELLDAAEAGSLDLETQARRMIASPRFADAIQEFYRQWLGLDRLDEMTKDSNAYPEFNVALSRDLRASLEAFLDHVHFGPTPSLATLFTGDKFFINERLAGVYGGSASGDMLTPTEGRPGLLAHPGLLALLAKPDQSDPIHRGLFVRRQLLCQELPAPPNDADLVVEDPAPGLSTRDRFAQHTASAACASCHELIDPIGFAFESFDGMGRVRVEDEGVTVDTTGGIVNGGDATSTFDGVDELTQVLATSERVRQCYATQWFRFALRRQETSADGCSLVEINQRFSESGGDLNELLLSIVTSDAFRHRRSPELDGGEEDEVGR